MRFLEKKFAKSFHDSKIMLTFAAKSVEKPIDQERTITGVARIRRPTEVLDCTPRHDSNTRKLFCQRNNKWH